VKCGCGARWSSARQCHCAACHETFSTPSNFDRHRRDFQCINPAQVGLVRSGFGPWKMPGDPQRQSVLYCQKEESHE
jgi:hypothetical protein